MVYIIRVLVLIAGLISAAVVPAQADWWVDYTRAPNSADQCTTSHIYQASGCIQRAIAQKCWCAGTQNCYCDSPDGSGPNPLLGPDPGYCSNLVDIPASCWSEYTAFVIQGSGQQSDPHQVIPGCVGDPTVCLYLFWFNLFQYQPDPSSVGRICRGSTWDGCFGGTISGHQTNPFPVVNCEMTRAVTDMTIPYPPTTQERIYIQAPGGFKARDLMVSSTPSTGPQPTLSLSSPDTSVTYNWFGINAPATGGPWQMTVKLTGVTGSCEISDAPFPSPVSPYAPLLVPLSGFIKTAAHKDTIRGAIREQNSREWYLRRNIQNIIAAGQSGGTIFGRVVMLLREVDLTITMLLEHLFDPVDPDYSVFTLATLPPYTQAVAGGDLTAAQADSINAWMTERLQVLAYLAQAGAQMDKLNAAILDIPVSGTVAKNWAMILAAGIDSALHSASSHGAAEVSLRQAITNAFPAVAIPAGCNTDPDGDDAVAGAIALGATAAQAEVIRYPIAADCEPDGTWPDSGFTDPSAIAADSAAYSSLGQINTLAAICSVDPTGVDLCAATWPVTLARAGTGAGTVASSAPGLNCGMTCTHRYPAASGMVLTATASPGSVFTSWSGNCSGTNPTCTLSNIQAAKNVTAAFTPSYDVTVTKIGTATGTVTSSPSGISCGAVCTKAFATTVLNVVLTAAPSSGATFKGWSGACTNLTGTCTVHPTGLHTATAQFDISQFTLTVTKAGLGTGTVTSAPLGINCGSDCVEIYNTGTSVTLSKTPAAGSVFSSWSGACGGVNSCVLNMTANRAVTANWASLVTVSTTVSLLTGATGTIKSTSPTGLTCTSGTCSHDFPFVTTNSTVTLTETPGSGSHFVGWSNGPCSGTGSTCVIRWTGSHSVTGTFAKP